jgi:hypothetical protein
VAFAPEHLDHFEVEADLGEERLELVEAESEVDFV